MPERGSGRDPEGPGGHKLGPKGVERVLEGVRRSARMAGSEVGPKGVGGGPEGVRIGYNFIILRLPHSLSN